MQYLWIAIFSAVLVWSGIVPKDQFTWLLAVAPAIIGGILLALVGAMCALLLLPRWHDHQLATLSQRFSARK
jgi:uncharacterized membrane protein YjdF